MDTELGDLFDLAIHLVTITGSSFLIGALLWWVFKRLNEEASYWQLLVYGVTYQAGAFLTGWMKLGGLLAIPSLRAAADIGFHAAALLLFRLMFRRQRWATLVFVWLIAEGLAWLLRAVLSPMPV